jgi:hypothetical protein
MPNKKNWMLDNCFSIMATAIGFLIVTQLGEKTDSIESNTAALQTLTVTVALLSQAVLSTTDGVEDLDERLRLIEINRSRND